MGWKLHEDLSFCRVDSRFIFLDVGRDCYFRLPELQERAFASLLDGNGLDEVVIRDLSDRHILEETVDPYSIPQPPSIPPVTRSMVEDADDNETPGLGALMEVLATTYTTSRQLKRCSLKAVLDQTTSYRRNHVLRATRTAIKQKIRDLHRPSAAFMRARAVSPIGTTCLLDSLSMLKFLAKRGIHASLVFAVTSDPFSAHCWLQSGDIILNDTVGSARAHTPIWML